MKRYLLFTLVFATGVFVGSWKTPEKVYGTSHYDTGTTVDLSQPVTIVEDGRAVRILTPHCATVDNVRLFSHPVPDVPVTVVRMDGGRVQVGYTDAYLSATK